MTRHPISAAWKSVTSMLFDRGGFWAIFEHARNVAVATIFVAAGLEAVRKYTTLTMAGLFNATQAGYVVASVGFLLILLNFVHGLRKLANLKRHIAWQIALAILYLFFTLRIVQLIVVLRSHQC